MKQYYDGDVDALAMRCNSNRGGVYMCNECINACRPGTRLNIKTLLSQVKDKTVLTQSYLWHGDSYNGNASLYWDGRRWFRWQQIYHVIGKAAIISIDAICNENKDLEIKKKIFTNSVHEQMPRTYEYNTLYRNYFHDNSSTCVLWLLESPAGGS